MRTIQWSQGLGEALVRRIECHSMLLTLIFALQNAKAGSRSATDGAQQFRRGEPPTSRSCEFPSRLRRYGVPSLASNLGQ